MKEKALEAEQRRRTEAVGSYLRMAAASRREWEYRLRLGQKIAPRLRRAGREPAEFFRSAGRRLLSAVMALFLGAAG